MSWGFLPLSSIMLGASRVLSCVSLYQKENRDDISSPHTGKMAVNAVSSSGVLRYGCNEGYVAMHSDSKIQPVCGYLSIN